METIMDMVVMSLLGICNCQLWRGLTPFESWMLGCEQIDETDRHG